MLKNILFISCPKYGVSQYEALRSSSLESNYADLFSASAYIPLGLLSIESYLKSKVEKINSKIIPLDAIIQTEMMKNGIEDVINNLINSYDKYLESILLSHIEYKPQIVGISVMFDVSVEPALLIAQIIKKHFPNATVIVGGHPATTRYKDLLELSKGNIDAVSFGEGEKPFVRLVQSESILSLLDCDRSFVTNEKRFCSADYFKNDVIDNLDEIPVFDYSELIESDFYQKSLEYSKKSTIFPNLSGVSLMTSRGCPHKCIFCASHRVHGKKVREFSLDRIKREIDLISKTSVIKSISIKDDHFLYNEKRAIEICDYAYSKGIRLSFPNGFAMSYITKDFVDCLVRTGVEQVSLALESGSERVLKEIIHKPLTLKKASEVFSLFSHTDIFVLVYCVVGFPDESLRDIKNCVEYLNNEPLDWVGFSGATPVSGSEFFDQISSQVGCPDFDEQVFFTSDYSNSETKKIMNNNVKMTVELYVNYLNNGMMRKGKYSEAKEYFKKILESYPQNAFAYYCIEKCNEKLKIRDNSLDLFYEIISKDVLWRNYAEYFKLI